MPSVERNQGVQIRKPRVTKICTGEVFNDITEEANTESEINVSVLLSPEYTFGKRRGVAKKIIIDEVIVAFWNYKYRIQSPRGCLQSNKCSV